MKRLILLAMLTAAGYACAEDWVIYSTGDSDSGVAGERVILQVNPTSILSREGYRQAWWRFNYVPSRREPNMKERVGSSAMLTMYDCSNRESSPLQVVFYSAAFSGGHLIAGSAMNSSRAEAIRKMSSHVPGSFGADGMTFVCAYPIK